MTDRRTYMRNYMRRRRQDSKFRDEERLKDKLVKRKKRGFPKKRKNTPNFPSYKECKAENPDLTFKEWLAEKIEWEKDRKLQKEEERVWADIWGY
jgi:hypothetical protein